MKKRYFFMVLFTFVVVSFSAQVQILDDMESYTDGFPVFQDHWTSWSGTTADAGLASSNQAHYGVQSYFVDGNGTISGVLNLGNKIFGEWSLLFHAYIPSGKEGYFDVQANVPIIPELCNQFFFNQNNQSPGIGEITGTFNTTFTFPHDQWFYVYMEWDISAGLALATWASSIDYSGGDPIEVVPPGTRFYNWDGNTPTGLGGIHFLSTGATNELYIDDIYYGSGYFGIEDFNQLQFKAYPNPVTNVLTVSAEESIQSISIYNTLGQLIYSEELNALTTQVDMANYEKGVYFVNATIGKSEGTLKIIK